MAEYFSRNVTICKRFHPRKCLCMCIIYTPSHPHTLTPSPSQLLELKDVVSVRRCRLVRYDDYTECLDQSFDDSEVSEGVWVCGCVGVRV